MSRLRRIVLNVATVLSLGLGLAAAVLWVRSYLVSDSIYRSRWWSQGREQNESAWWLLAGRGEVGLGSRRQQYAASLKFMAVHFSEYSWKQARPAEVGGTSYQSKGFIQ
jgi:hypothetical protein